MRHCASWLAGMFVLGLVASGCAPEGQQNAGMPGKPHVMAGSTVQAGRYLAMIDGCNDCHTPDYLFNGGQTPESDWLIGGSVGGGPIGSQGPFGTSYVSNLRIFVQETPEAEFLGIAKTRNANPPMPWWVLHEMSEHDLKAVYAYIKSLPVKGDKMPEFVPPDGEVTTPVLRLFLRLPDGTEMGPPPAAEGSA